MLLSIVLYGDPLLRKKCAKVEKITPAIRKLVGDMLETMDASNGIGLAAIQVGHLLRIFILRNYREDEKGNMVLTHHQVYINPRLSNPSDDTQTDTEGCLSIPKVRAEVTRPYAITVEALDLDGNPFTEQLEGYKARVVMHENDHINGQLFIDRLTPAEKKRIAPQLAALKSRFGVR